MSQTIFARHYKAYVGVQGGLKACLWLHGTCHAVMLTRPATSRPRPMPGEAKPRT
jgi:hypothetical protein